MRSNRIPNAFYWKLAGICFVIGGCMEAFMYSTGFYDIVTRKEAERFAESYEERQELLRKLHMDMLRNITAGSAASANPLLRSILGPSASEAEYKELAAEAERLWQHMDKLAEADPDQYKEFVRDAAEAAREEAERGRDPHVQGLAPALMLEAQATVQRQKAEGAGLGTAVDVARVVVPGGQAVVRVHVWAATDASGVPPPHTIGGAPLPAAPQPPPPSWSGLVVPLAQYKPPASSPGPPLPVHHFHLAAHTSGVAWVADGGAPALTTAFLEAVSQFVEAEYGLVMSRSLRTLQVHREAVNESRLRELVRQHEERLAAAAETGVGASGKSGDSDRPVEQAVPQGLLQELRLLGTPSAGKTARKDGAAVVAGSRVEEAAKTGKKPLIEELS